MHTGIDVVQLTRDLVAMNTVNPPGHEKACADFLANILFDAGFDTEFVDFGEGRTNLLARLGGTEDSKPLCLTGHLDTVPLGDAGWSVDPFGGEVREDRIYGRGTTDMKGGVAAITVAAIRLADELSGTPGITIIFTGGEETGCNGAKALCEASSSLGQAGAIIVGEPTSNVPLIGHKGALWLNVICRGVTAHGSTPELGDNAVHTACRAVGKLEDFGFNIPPHPMLGSPSVNVGTFRGGINVNSVPDRASFELDIRTIPDQRHASVVDHLHHFLPEADEIVSFVDVGGVISDFEDAWIQQVRQVIGPMLDIPIEARTAKYFTDASVLKPAFDNPPTLILGPGDAGMAHKTDEYCKVPLLYQAVDLYEAIIRNWCRLDKD